MPCATTWRVRARLFLSSNFLLGCIIGLSLPGPTSSLFAQDFQITSASLEPDGRPRLQFQSDTNSYYILLQGTDVTAVDTPTVLTLGLSTNSAVTDPSILNPQQSTKFYRVLRVPLSAPLDSDADGIDDVWELRHIVPPNVLDPLDPADAALDPDGDGRSNLTEYQAAVFPITTIAESSPANGESGVAVTRETIFRFNHPLAPSTLLTTNNLCACFGGRQILARIELSTDRKKVTLFYQEPLPASARVRVTFNGTNLTDYLGRALDLDDDGQPGGNAIVDFDTLSITPVAGTAVIAHVFASLQVPVVSTNITTNFVDHPLPGVLISVIGAEQEIFTTTDAQGFFRLTNCPAGKFFVSIDGRTSPESNWPNGDYYPLVGKPWEAVAGRTNNLAGGTGLIYLPLVQAGTLQPINPIADTTIGFPTNIITANPAWAGVSVTIPTNALYSDNGARGGRVGLAPVPADRLPERLPAGIVHALDISIQTDGPQNVDRPLPVRFPNLPDPQTGLKLPPGAKSALMSYNHDTGRWEVQGPMTVTADGNYVETDPGVGVRQPGWHGTMGGTQGEGGAITGPPPGSSPGDIDGDGKPNGSDDDVDGDGKKNGDDDDVDGDGQGNGDDADIDGDGIPNGQDGDMDGDGIPNGSDPDKDGDGIPNDDDGEPDGNQDCIPQGVDCLTSPLRQPNPNHTPSYNGCTAMFLGGFLAANNLEHPVNFYAACNRHDLDYDTYSTDPGNKDAADMRLRNNCYAMIQAQASLLTPEEIADAQADADAIFQGVQMFGGPFYRRAQLNASICPYCPETLPPFEFFAQTATTLQSGPHVYAIRNVDNPSAPVLRGRTGGQGYAHDAIVLAPNTRYQEWVLQLRTMRYAVAEFSTPSAGQRFKLPTFNLLPPGSLDTDGDGLHSIAEFVVGSDLSNPDSDDDGVLDGVEIQDGTDPLDGLPASIGIIAATDTPGTAVDVCAINDLAVVANREAGVSVLNVAGQNPIRIAEVDTPGTALRVACSGNLIAVADGAAGLAIIDITDPPAARILHQVNLGSPAQAIAAAGGLAYAGLANGEIVTVDLTSGTVLERFSASGAVFDLGLDADTLFVLIDNQLRAYRFGDAGLELVGTVGTAGFGADGISGSKRLFVGGGYAYVSSFPGYDVIVTGNPAAMQRVGNAQNTGSQSFKQIIANGSGLGVAMIGATATPNSDHDVFLYDLSNPAQTTQVISGVLTPGIAYAASIYNGRAYVADGASGLQVINYLAYDSGTNPPSITLTANFMLSTTTNGVAEEGKLARVTAGVTDDVQVRHVEFYVDGARVITDGNFPFEHRFVTPRITTSKTNFTVRAKATDTGGNFAWSEEVLVDLTPDATPPRVLRTDPATNSIVSITNPPSAAFAYFNEPMDISTLNFSNYQLVWAGADNRLGTSDDLLVGATVTYRDTINAGVLEFPSPLGLGVYQATISSNVTDAAGNHLASDFGWTFAVLAGGPDDDDDGDEVTNAEELARGLNPLAADTDGDGWTDRVEIDDGTDGANPNSRPSQVFLARPPVLIDLPSPDTAGTSGVGVLVARPPVQIDLPSADTFGITGVAAVFAQPPVEILLPSPDIDGSAGETVFLALPPLQIDLPGPDTAGTNSPGLFLGKPPVSIVITNQ